MIGSFGEITFEVGRAPEPGLSEERAASYEEHNVIGGAPPLERTGRAATTLRLTLRLRGEVAPFDLNVAEELEALRSALEGEPRRLVLGDKTYGRHVLERLTITMERMTGRTVVAADVDARFKEYN